MENIDIVDTTVKKKNPLTPAEQARILLALSIVFFAVVIAGALIVAVNIWSKGIVK